MLKRLFDKIFPYATFKDEENIDNDTVVKENQETACCICGSFTKWRSEELNIKICSIECLQEAWKEPCN
jgi:hypothetical protein